ncbi:2-oxoglutarate dehydrogenase complex dihydrolipoyllysine-residue succinyltransferase [bacterium]|nr:2-oxoglutarate dehydrogenase complex dihydrolipoyllysine-residue succinyltransferase [bacterium]
MADIVVPVLGESVKEATVGAWLKKAGDHVTKDEVLVELETDKVSVEVSAAEDGVLSEVLAKQGETVEIGAVLGRIGSSAGNGAGASAKQTPAPAAPKQQARTTGDKTMDIVVPTMGESVTEGSLSRWLVKAGEEVSQDQPIAEIETDKVAIEVPAPAAGVVSELLVKEGVTVGIGDIIARFLAGGSSGASSGGSGGGAKPAAASAATAATTSRAAAADAPEKVAPSVRRIATEAGVDPSNIPGTGRDGRATKADAMKFVAEGAGRTSGGGEPVQARPARDLGPREERVKMTRLRQTIARRLKEAQDTAAMLTTFNDVDMSAVMELRKKYKDAFEKKHGSRLGFMGFFVKACIQALKEIPAVNAEIDGDDIIYKNFYNIGVAVGTPKGLVVPVVRDADIMSVAEIEAEIGRLGGLARDNKLSLEDLQGGTFTISNGGVYGSLMSTPILNPPQSGVLGMHRIEDRPVVVNGQIVIRPMMYLALSYDHRLVDGKEAVTFLVRVKETLEDPERVLLDL